MYINRGKESVLFLKKYDFKRAGKMILLHIEKVGAFCVFFFLCSVVSYHNLT